MTNQLMRGRRLAQTPPSESAEGETSFTTTLFVRDHCLCLHVQRAARALARRFDDALRPLDLTNGQFSLLMSLNRPQPAGMGSVAQLLAMDRTTLTAALKPLERRGLLKVSVDLADKRGRLLTLTPAGRKLLAKAVPIWKSHHAAIESGLGDPDRLRRDLTILS
ncbi:MarR family winged helix-turn-helix transcriptional regulator [Dongia rigui]|uniref:MarR family winged helix-turn-helix transcriptional regulator n=1 Tax=Dongia rigui TaxID=940149 RepID=A0ABU5DUX2_9PROT|nr:MarR family winged helix-turn-helix transcriptional regulator [Dongia rigui]MDY0871018.1 MarR family winged helix-turn-helix transcriptional regulator [Dongia rigui]